MLNAIEPGSVVPIHRHRKSSETVVCLRGRLVEELYDDWSASAPSGLNFLPIVLWLLSLFQLANGIRFGLWNPAPS